MNLNVDPRVEGVYASYPQAARDKLIEIREHIIEIAAETEEITRLEETLKWGEPSYLSNSGSTVRLAWRKAYPGQVAVLFNCKTLLIETFKELYGDLFTFEGNRAILFGEDEKIPEKAIKHCLLLALTYHQRKKLWMLGA